MHRRLYEPHLGATDLMRPPKCGLQQVPTDSALRSRIDSERSNRGYRAFGYDREENAANDPPVPLDQKSLRVRVIHLAPDKSSRNCERGKLRRKIVRSGNGGVCPKSHRRTGLCVLGAHVSKLGIGITHLDASWGTVIARPRSARGNPGPHRSRLLRFARNDNGGIASFRVNRATRAFAPVTTSLPNACAWSLQHDPEKVGTGFRKRSCSNNKIERDDDSKESHRALAR